MLLERLRIPPLLLKELIELAAKPRTYIVRGLYALGLLTLFLAIAASDIKALSQGNRTVLGAGNGIFNQLIGWQYCALYLFIPLLIAPLVSEDEERGNLDILIVSGIGPFEFLLQKMLSRLVGMGTLLLLSLPLAGIAYCLGGVDSDMIVAAAISMLVGCLQIGSWAIWCSAREPTSMSAVKRTYLAGLVWLLLATPLLILVPWLLALVVDSLQWHNHLTHALVAWLSDQSFYPFTLYLWACSTHASLWQILGNCPLLLASSALAMWGAVRAMRLRSTTMSAQMIKQMKVFRNEFRYERHRRAQIIKRGMDHEALPADQPVAWREQRQIVVLRRLAALRSSGRWPKAIVGVCIMFMVWMGYRIEYSMHDYAWSDPHPWNLYNIFALIILICAVPSMAISASGLFAGERSRRSLELLLILPMSTTALLAEKTAGCTAMAQVFLGALAIPLVGQVAAEIVQGVSWSCVFHVPIALLIAWVYMQVTIWMTVAVSLRVRSHVHASIIALSIVVAWCGLPPIVLSLFNNQVDWQFPHFGFVLSLISPGSAIMETVGTDSSWLGRSAAFILVYGGFFWLLRWRALGRADDLLGRLA